MPAPPPPAFLKDRPSETRNGLLVNFTQAKAGAAAAPDPLRGLDGKRIRTTSDWIGRRRDEVLKLLLDNQYGRPPTSDGGLSERTFLASDDGLALGGLAHREQIALMAGESRIDVVLYLPAQAKGPVPVVLNVLFSPTIVMVDDPGVREVDGWDASHNRINGRAARPIAKPDIAPYLARGYGVALV